MIDDLTDEPEYDEGPDRDTEVPCFHCHRPTVGEQCGFCGNELCPACFEMGGGFCNSDHTQQQIDAYEDEAYPPADEEELNKRVKGRKGRDEMIALGILPVVETTPHSGNRSV